MIKSSYDDRNIYIMFIHHSFMVKYKCPVSECKYVSDKPGDCCGQKLMEISDKEAEKLKVA